MNHEQSAMNLILANHLIIFTRYPEPGKTKTRMIPYLGAEGAAKLQRQMTEHTLLTASKLDRDVAIEIHFTGGDRSLMQDWLGNQLIYQPQTNGDLGDRMQSALASALKRGSDRVVLIGVDCPDLNASILTEAFQMLDRHDLVLGPAVDGGYYLIGLSRLVPELFVGINWGSDRVLAQTKDIANRLQLNTHYLPILNDVDLPEDLSIWQRSLLGRGAGGEVMSNE
jgi:hypothetical protein